MGSELRNLRGTQLSKNYESAPTHPPLPPASEFFLIVAAHSNKWIPFMKNIIIQNILCLWTLRLPPGKTRTHLRFILLIFLGRDGDGGGRRGRWWSLFRANFKCLWTIFFWRENWIAKGKAKWVSGFKGYQSHSPFARNSLARRLRPHKTVLYPKSATSRQCVFKWNCPRRIGNAVHFTNKI